MATATVDNTPTTADTVPVKITAKAAPLGKIAAFVPKRGNPAPVNTTSPTVAPKIPSPDLAPKVPSPNLVPKPLSPARPFELNTPAKKVDVAVLMAPKPLTTAAQPEGEADPAAPKSEAAPAGQEVPAPEAPAAQTAPVVPATQPSPVAPASVAPATETHIQLVPKPTFVPQPAASAALPYEFRFNRTKPLLDDQNGYSDGLVQYPHTVTAELAEGVCMGFFMQRCVSATAVDDLARHMHAVIGNDIKHIDPAASPFFVMAPSATPAPAGMTRAEIVSQMAADGPKLVKRYTVLICQPNHQLWMPVQFDTEDFMQGYNTACRWLGLDYKQCYTSLSDGTSFFAM